MTRRVEPEEPVNDTDKRFPRSVAEAFGQHQRSFFLPERTTLAQRLVYLLDQLDRYWPAWLAIAAAIGLGLGWLAR